MKVKNYFKKSLARQVLLIMGSSIIIFIVCVGALFYILQQLNEDFIQTRNEIKEKQRLITDIYEAYDTTFLNIRGYIAFDNLELKESAINQEEIIRKKAIELKQITNTAKDQVIYQDIIDFADFYYINTLPGRIADFEKGGKQAIAEKVTASDTPMVNSFRENNSLVMKDMDDELEDNLSKLTKRQSNVQIAAVVIFFFFFIFMQYSIRVFFKNIGRPLADLSIAANEIIAGRDAVITLDSNRMDELGTLSNAFKKMVASVQEKEQDLLAHNEELVAQQDELHSQQDQLQETLEILTDNEQMLKRRNEFINGISTSLDQSEVLQSIVENMCNIISAERGIIFLIKEENFAAFGISDYGVKQFQMNLNSGLNQRLKTSKRPFTFKREQDSIEKGYHEGINYSYDLYLPVLNAYQEIEAIMVFSRYGDQFTEKNIDECVTLAKQIGISLEKIRLYEQSEANSRLNQDILNTVQEGIQLVDNNGEIVHVNRKFAEILGKENIKELVGMSWESWTALVTEQVVEDNVIDNLRESIHSPEEQEDQSFIYQKKDSKQVIKVYCKKLKLGDEAYGTVIVHRDITKEYEVDQMKSEFVSTVSHELRTPLASVLGFTELMLNRELKPERKTKYLQTIYNEAKRLTALINDFLDVQRMESGKQTYEKKYIDLLPALKKTIEHQEINAAHTITFTVDMDEAVIMGDRVKVEQVFTNLLNNSIKYSPDGGEIHVKVSSTDGRIKVAVIDHGLGIPKDALPNLFQKFYRVDNSDRRRIGGTGLGLSIVEEIVKAHGGSIAVESVYGEGSMFTIEFPKVVVSTTGKPVTDDDHTLSYSIMVIEDDLSLAELLNHELQDSGFQVTHVKSGTTAWEMIQQVPPDAIVLDIMLEEGDMDGWALMQKLKENPQLKDLPIFISTALDEKERGFSLGAKDYLVKPYQPSQLSKMILHTLLSNGKRGQIMVPQRD